MITCKNVKENLIDALAEEQIAPEVLAHLRECGTCSAELDGLRKTMSLLDEWEVPEPSPYFLTRVKAHARDEQHKAAHAGPLSWFRRPVLAATFAAVLAAGGVVLRLSVFENETPATPQVGTAVADIEQLDKNADVLVNTDLIDELSGAPSDDVAEP